MFRYALLLTLSLCGSAIFGQTPRNNRVVDSLVSQSEVYKSMNVRSRFLYDSLQREILFYRVKEDFYGDALSNQTNLYLFIFTAVITLASVINWKFITNNLNRVGDNVSRLETSTRNEVTQLNMILDEVGKKAEYIERTLVLVEAKNALSLSEQRMSVGFPDDLAAVANLSWFAIQTVLDDNIMAAAEGDDQLRSRMNSIVSVGVSGLHNVLSKIEDRRPAEEFDDTELGKLLREMDENDIVRLSIGKIVLDVVTEDKIMKFASSDVRSDYTGFKVRWSEYKKNL